MSRLATVLVAVALGATCLPRSASADFCLRLTGGSFSGDIGFFRFTGKLPTKAGKMVDLHGRAAGLSPVFGAATVQKDGSGVEIGATFFIDASEGQFDVFLASPTFTAGSGYGSYGQYDVGDSVAVAVVDCATEP